LFLLIGLFSATSITGAFFSILQYFIARGSLFDMPFMMQPNMTLTAFLSILPFFIMLLIGVFAVEMSLFKLAKCQAGNENPISITLP